MILNSTPVPTPDLPYRTARDGLGNAAEVQPDTSGDIYVVMNGKAVCVSEMDRLELAAAIAGDLGTVTPAEPVPVPPRVYRIGERVAQENTCEGTEVLDRFGATRVRDPLGFWFEPGASLDGMNWSQMTVREKDTTLMYVSGPTR